MYFAHHSRPNIFENDAMQNVINNNNNNNTLHDHFDEITACNMNSNPIKTKQNQKKQWSKEVTTHTTGVQLRSYPHKRSSILKTEIAMFFISDTIQNRSRNSQQKKAIKRNKTKKCLDL